MTKKTGALVFFIGCGLGLCISEILVGVATQRAQQDSRKASLEYITQVRNITTVYNSSNHTFANSAFKRVTAPPDEHLAILHSDKGKKNRILAAQIIASDTEEPSKHRKSHQRTVHERHSKRKKTSKNENDDKDEDDDADDDEDDEDDSTPLRIITTEDHERKHSAHKKHSVRKCEGRDEKNCVGIPRCL